MTEHAIKHTNSEILCKAMYDTIRSYMSECYIALWIPKARIKPEWLAPFEARGLHLELRGNEYFIRNRRR